MNYCGKLLNTGIMIAGIAAMLLAGCQSATEMTSTSPPPSPDATPTATATPTEIPQPQAALVNGVGIPLAFFESEVGRYIWALNDMEQELMDEEVIRETVLNDLIDQTLLAQSAYAGGFEMTDALLDERIAALAGQMGGQQALDNWLVMQGYTQADFEQSLQLSIAASWQRDVIIKAVPDALEQVHARQVFAYTEAGANRALTSLNSGTDFDKVAWEFSPETGGELGWFPRGYLTVPAVEDAAFSLPVGQYSQIIKSELGYHIVMVIERADQRPLTNDARQALQRRALSDWITTARGQAQIEVLVP